ncbi:hypothetical protein N9C06_06935 [Salibacteraceae bacterium]|jgi:3-deoxy-D-manno-octulosonic-acid transferase|nr:hypothetical protein [Salibacteraceae bacterium]
MFRLLYDVFIALYGIAIRLSPSEKARKWREGRIDLFESIEKQDLNNCTWFHCASVGEFEQARPLIELLRTESDSKILLTFFSPSGYEVHKDYASVDYVCYLPIDKRTQMLRMIDLVKPSKLILVKYELWYHLMKVGVESGVEMYLVAARFRPDQAYFKWWASPFLRVLKKFNGIYVQDSASYNLLKKCGFQNVQQSGDPRFDRVLELKKQDLEFDRIEDSSRKVLVAGSTWEKDEKILFEWLEGYNDKWCLILVPHEWHAKDQERLKAHLKNRLAFFSEGGKLNGKTDVLVVDAKGILSRLYRVGDLNYVGGGFGAGIHNILEACVYGNPVVFGPNHRKFGEAAEVLSLGFGQTVMNSNDLDSAIQELSSHDWSEDIQNYFGEKGQVSEGLFQSIFNHQ